MNNTRLFELDALRGVAVILVLGRHLPRLPDNISPWLDVFFSNWYKAGWCGVDFFFVLSGFLVSGLIFKEFKAKKCVNVKRFLIRRGFKIYPSFYVMILVTIIYSLHREGSVDFGKIVIECLYVQNYWQGLWAHTWSLAVEEHFYLLIALGAVLVGYKKVGRQKYIHTLIWLAIVLISVNRIRHALQIDFKVTTHVFPSHLRMDALAWGVLLSFYYHYHASVLSAFLKKRVFILLPLALAISTLPLFYRLHSLMMHSIGFTLISIGFMFLLAYTLHLPRVIKPVLAVVLWPIYKVGYYSYSIYLWHIPIEAWMLNGGFSEDSFWGFVVCYLFFSVFGGIIIANVIEFPFLKIRERVAG